MHKTIKLSLLILLATIFSSYGQNELRSGFIITLDNNIVQGELEYRQNSKNYESCIFKGAQGKIEYSPGQINGFGYDNDKFFASQIVEGTFVEVLVDGKISLYKSKDKYHLKKDGSVHDLESTVEEVEVDGKKALTETSKWRGIVNYLTSDCIVGDGAADLKLTEKKLTRFIVNYNECSGTEFTEYKENKPWSRFEFGLTTELSKTEMKFPDNGVLFQYLDESYVSTDQSIGVLMAVTFPRISENTSLQIEFHFRNMNYSSVVEIPQFPIRFHTTNFDLTTISIPLSFKYAFPGNTIGWYFQAGVNIDKHLSKEATLRTEQIERFTNIVTTTEGPAFEPKGNQVGPWGGIGVFKPFKKFKVDLGTRYYHIGQINKRLDFPSSGTRISINLTVVKI